MLKVIFYQKSDKIDKNGESPIFARLSFKNQRISISTCRSISKKRWLFTNNLRNVLKLEKEKVIKNSLDLFQLNAEKKLNELFKIDPEVSLELLKADLVGKVKTNLSTKQITIIEILDKYNKHFRRKVAACERSSASLQKYERSKELLLNFMKKNYEINDIPALEISSSFIYKLEEFLKYESNFKDGYNYIFYIKKGKSRDFPFFYFLKYK
ncbi:hypothetical protein [Flavobacterium granuli]|uniref:Arm DNA-binding domain-containing protein n=1 Tax=Flavobacterium granuli TaxID=280093 RepID=A0ABU1S126_9FLAO|nr:hypothetical protein [Flavobacterium granuli]MDR6844724.1 hypothetical protein [Flavobacterium granuli]